MLASHCAGASEAWACGWTTVGLIPPESATIARVADTSRLTMSATHYPSSTTTAPLPNPDRWNFAVVLLAIIFLLDWFAPANVQVPALYVLPTLLFAWARRFKEHIRGRGNRHGVDSRRTLPVGFGGDDRPYSQPAGRDRDYLGNRRRVVSFLRVVERWSRQVSTTNGRLPKASFNVSRSCAMPSTSQRSWRRTVEGARTLCCGFRPVFRRRGHRPVRHSILRERDC